jgi:hypothetical protein
MISGKVKDGKMLYLLILGFKSFPHYLEFQSALKILLK